MIQLRNSVIVTYFLVTFVTYAVLAQSLERRAFLGVDLNYEKGLEVCDIIPNSTAQKMGLEKGDIIKYINNKPIETDQDIFISLKEARVGDKIILTYERAGKQFTVKQKLGALPEEQYNNMKVIYDQVKAEGNVLRSIVTKPTKQGKYPAVLLVQGVGCYSVDTPFDTNSGHIQVLLDLTENDFVTMRLDKSGVGDSEGTPCDQLSFQQELKGFEEGIEALREYDFVDGENIFIIGHSVGGVMAPVIAKEKNCKGIVVYGTIGKNWMEYLRANQEKQLREKDYDFDEIEKMVVEMNECYVDYLLKENTMKEVMEINPNCTKFLKKFSFRSDEYWHQINRQNVAAAWQKYNGYVLSLWGEYDWATNKEEHELIVNIVNQNDSQKGTFEVVANSDHKMRLIDEGEQLSKSYNKAISKTIIHWMKNKTQVK
ncbi:MAG: serine aminopeptidase domain-containing protein [Thermonemataceae bacterium]